MAKYVLGAPEMNEREISSSKELISIIKGRSIISAADWGKDRFELGLSGNLMIRFFQTSAGMIVNLVDTTNSNENPSLVIDMGDMGRRVPISTIIIKLDALRTLYAIYYLIYAGREKELQFLLLNHPDGDIEQKLLSNEERLYIESVSYGSWVLTVWAKTRIAYKSIISVAGLVFARGREAFLQKYEADARLKNAEADLKQLEVQREKFELGKDQLDYLLQVSDKLDSPEAKIILKDKLIDLTKKFTLDDRSDNKSYGNLK